LARVELMNRDLNKHDWPLGWAYLIGRVHAVLDESLYVRLLDTSLPLPLVLL
jgi:hypothetical protein